jgi:hypothetical protein
MDFIPFLPRDVSIQDNPSKEIQPDDFGSHLITKTQDCSDNPTADGFSSHADVLLNHAIHSHHAIARDRESPTQNDQRRQYDLPRAS